MTNALVSNRPVKVGDVVCFKSDIEQSGTIVAIQFDTLRRKYVLTLENKAGFEGEYLEGSTKTNEDANDCWVE